MSRAAALGNSRATVRDAVIAFVALSALYALGPYGLPLSYFLIAWFDLFQNSLWPGMVGSAYEAALVGYVAVLSVGAAGVGRFARSRRDGGSPRWWSDAVGGALVVLGLLALGFGAVVLASGNLVPALVSVVTAAALLVGGLFALRR